MIYDLIKSTSTFSIFTFISRILDILGIFLIAITLGSGPLSDAFFVAFRYQIHLEDYFLKEHSMQPLFHTLLS